VPVVSLMRAVSSAGTFFDGQRNGPEVRNCQAMSLPVASTDVASAEPLTSRLSESLNMAATSWPSMLGAPKPLVQRISSATRQRV
jgi:hypothetical protein